MDANQEINTIRITGGAAKHALPYLKARKKEFEQDPNKGLQLSTLKKLLESLGE